MRKSAVLLASLLASLLFSTAGIGTAHATTTNTAEDNFTRPNMLGTWGTTTNNDGLPNLAWRRSLGGNDASSPFVQILNDQGVLTYTGHNGRKIAGYLPITANPGGDVLVEATFSNLGQALFGATIENNSGGTQWYQAQASTYSKDLEIVKRLGGIMYTEATIPFGPYVAGQAYWLREDVSVTAGVATVAMRVWADGTTEPTTWQLTWTDPTPLPPGQVGVMADWKHTTVPSDHVSFSNFAYAAAGLAVPAT